MTERHALTDAEYGRLRPLLPSNEGKRGRPYTLDHRRTLDGILWVLQTGAAWRDLPARYGDWRGGIDRALFCADGTSVRAHRCAAGASKKKPRRASRPTTPSAAAAAASPPS